MLPIITHSVPTVTVCFDCTAPVASVLVLEVDGVPVEPWVKGVTCEECQAAADYFESMAFDFYMDR